MLSVVANVRGDPVMSVRDRRSWQRRSAAALLVLVSLASACGDDEEGADGGPNSTVAAATEADGSSTTTLSADKDRPVGLYMMDPDGSNVKLVVAGDAFNPAWSPDGKKIVYQSGGVSDYDKKTEIHVVNADGTGDITLTDDPAFDTDPDWSADGSRIVFVREKNDGKGSRVWVMKADGSGETQIPPGSKEDDWQPSWARNGDRIAVSRRIQTPGRNTNRIVVMNPDGTGVTDLNAPDGFEPAWSPDGKRIAYMKMLNDLKSVIHVMNADGTGNAAVTTAAADDAQPAWSPDGTRIAFISDRSGESDFEIYVMAADGSGVTRLTEFNDSLQALSPVWSPDGKHILFSRLSPS